MDLELNLSKELNYDRKVRNPFWVINIASTPRYYDKPVLGYILVGNNSDSEMYVKLKKKACD